MPNVVAPDAPTMAVTVIDRMAMEAVWGRGRHQIITARVTIGAQCPRCGAPRGTPQSRAFTEDGDAAVADTWENPCGHVDTYVDVLAEARARSVAA